MDKNFYSLYSPTEPPWCTNRVRNRDIRIVSEQDTIIISYKVGVKKIATLFQFRKLEEKLPGVIN